MTRDLAIKTFLENFPLENMTFPTEITYCELIRDDSGAYEVGVSELIDGEWVNTTAYCYTVNGIDYCEW